MHASLRKTIFLLLALVGLWSSTQVRADILIGSGVVGATLRHFEIDGTKSYLTYNPGLIEPGGPAPMDFRIAGELDALITPFERTYQVEGVEYIYIDYTLMFKNVNLVGSNLPTGFEFPLFPIVINSLSGSSISFSGAEQQCLGNCTPSVSGSIEHGRLYLDGRDPIENGRFMEQYSIYIEASEVPEPGTALLILLSFGLLYSLAARRRCVLQRCINPSAE